MRRPMYATLAVLLVPLFPTSASLARETPVTAQVSAFATPISDMLPSALVVAHSPLMAGVGDGGFARPPHDEVTSAPPARTFEATRYRPRRDRYRERDRSRDRYDSGSRFRGASQLHAGFLDPEGPADPGFVVGFRGGQQIDQIVELGLGIDWRNKSGNATEVLQQSTGPGGEVIVVRRQLNRYSSNLFPVLAYLQVSAPSDLGLVPYFGFAGSYQALFLSAEDFQTGEEFEATYDGWGWQLWGGAAIPLTGRSRLVGELFLNQADLDREVFDSGTGETFRETVSTDGLGARFGINWGF